jgi:geranylgeranyl diphosphate synthase type I
MRTTGDDRVTTFAAQPAAPPSGSVPSGSAASDVLARTAGLVAPALAAAAERLDPALREPVEHHLLGGGKGVRGALVLLSAAAVGADEPVGVVGAVAVELVHNYSLLHDDIIDGDRERRHRPTVWAEFGVGTAIVAGDALAALATQLLLEEPTPERVQAARRLAGANQAMIAGQAADMAFESRPSVTVAECLAMEHGKTGALLSCAASLGAVLAGGPPAAIVALADFGDHLGVAFQAIDDLLGIWGEPAVTGKPVGSDLLAHKKALPVAAAIERGGPGAVELQQILAGELTDADVARATALIDDAGARAQVTTIADTHLDLALAALDRVDLDQPAKDELVAVAHFVTARDR